MLHSTCGEFAAHARVRLYLPLLAERFARERLHALAGMEATGPVTGARTSGQRSGTGS